ncbi:olfactory receptor 5AP2-like [Ambystoma mexicanum]|uniref:olfactory receptor 5AP2-like n=1 Tax=Ambystoma mexicanum TaxID=8296 RepID=UPI0037E89CC5
MKEGNWTTVKEFILLGLTDEPSLKIPLFVVFLLVYIITFLGNIGIITLIRISPRLHTSMYFLLSNLSFVDLCYSSVITPNMLTNFLLEDRSISVNGCVTQLFSFVFLGSTEVYLLTVMAYDRYIAICNPLLYSVIMNTRKCTCLVAAAYFAAFLNAMIHTCCTFMLSFCGSNKIIHFYCDVPPLLKLSCSDTSINDVVLVLFAGGSIVVSLVIVVTSYFHIVSAILKIHSSEGRQRAFSTCSSHFVCVILFFGTLVFMYLRPSSTFIMDQDRVASVFYTSIIPMLNPIIYSFRNQEVKDAIRKLMRTLLVFIK